MRIASGIVFILLLSTFKIFGQKFSVSDKTLSVGIIKDSLNKDSVIIEIKNTSKSPVLISMTDGINAGKYNLRYIGLGLYSGFFPYLPEHNKKYGNELSMKMVKPAESLKIKEKIPVNLLSGFSFSLDYVISSTGSSSEKILRKTYDKTLNFLKFDFRP